MTACEYDAHADVVGMTHGDNTVEHKAYIDKDEDSVCCGGNKLSIVAARAVGVNDEECTKEPNEDEEGIELVDPESQPGLSGRQAGVDWGVLT